MYYINYFFVTSILGHLIETIFFSNNGSGILFSYWTPVYGIGAIIIFFIYKYVNKLISNRFYKFIAIFIISSIALSLTEAISGYLIKIIFNKELWNYTNHKFHIGRYTSLEMASIWGISSTIFIYTFKPVIDKFINKIPKILSLLCISLFIIDIIVTIIIKT